MRTYLLAVGVALLLLMTQIARAADVQALLRTLEQVGSQGTGNEAAQAAWSKLAKLDATQLLEILAALDGANPLAANWIRSAVDAIAEREMARGGQLPAEQLEAFVLDTGHQPRARRLAFEWLARVDATSADRLIPRMLNDPGIEFRYDAVARLLSEAEPLLAAKKEGAARALYRRALSSARSLDQVQTITQRLAELGEKVDLPRHFGFVTRFFVIGPFDNVGGAGFAKAYPPEAQVRLDATYEGKQSKVRWKEFATSDAYGLVDLNAALANEQGAVAYATAEHNSAAAQDIELRIGSVNAIKVWLNGELLAAHEVYHSGNEIDQYVAPCRLHAGRNRILLKVCQNEQEEDWAKLWQFQMRVCDAVGTAVLSEESAKTARAAKD